MSDPLLPVGSNRCLCRGCGRYFSSVSAFGKHQGSTRSGETICHDPAERGLIFDGRYWKRPPDPEWVKKVRPNA
jgi:hypothetical protein